MPPQTGSPPSLPASCSESTVYIAAPKQIKIFVRRPAGLCLSCRSSPIAPPSSAATTSRTIVVDNTVPMWVPSASMAWRKSGIEGRPLESRRLDSPPKKSPPSRDFRPLVNPHGYRIRLGNRPCLINRHPPLPIHPDDGQRRQPALVQRFPHRI